MKVAEKVDVCAPPVEQNQQAPIKMVIGRAWSQGIYRALRLLGISLDVAWERAFICPITASLCKSTDIWQEKKIPLSKLNAITRLTITSKWSVAMMEIFLSLDKYPALCKLKLLGAS